MKLTIAVISKYPDVDKRFLRSLSFGDEIIVIYSENKDTKQDQDKNIRLLPHPLKSDFSQQRNYAISEAKGDWIFFVDTDEIVSDNLKNEIIKSIESNEYQGYFMRRIDLCFHQPFLHGETGDIEILRLAKRKAGKFTRSVHEYWKIKGAVGTLVHPLYHNKDHFISEFLSRISLYGPSDSLELNQENKSFSYFRLLIYPKAKFIVNYFIKLGFLDGLPGLFQAYLMMIQSLSVRVFQWIFLKSSIN